MSGVNGSPKGWAWTELTMACAKITDGTHHSPSKEQQTAEGEFLYITAKNIKEGGVELSNVTYVPEEVHRPIYERCDPELGDVLYIKDGVTTGIATVNQLQEQFSLLSSVALLKPHRSLLDPRFLKWYLNSPVGFHSMTSRMGGTAIKRLTVKKIKEGRVPVAPLNEQRRIVAKIEELFSDLDAGVAALERAKANLKRYRAAVLKAAVEGKLTEQWRREHADVEPASELLKRVLVERRTRWEAEQIAKYEAKGKMPPKGWRDKYKEPAEPDVDGLPELPDGWCWATVDAIGEVVGGITKGQKRNANHSLREVPYLRVANVQRGYLDLDVIKTIPARESEIDAYRLEKGDVLFNEGGDWSSPRMVGAEQRA